MKPLALYLATVFLILCGMLAVVKAIDPPQPVLLIDAAMPAPRVGGLFLTWCGAPTRPKDGISRT